MRIVLDTNVVISGLLWRGTPYRLLRVAGETDVVELIASPVLLAELSEVLRRPAMMRRLDLIGRTAERVFADYAAIVVSVVPARVRQVVTADPDDDHILAAAVEGNADLIVSGDTHLLTIGTYRGIRIVTPSVALEIVAG